MGGPEGSRPREALKERMTASVPKLEAFVEGRKRNDRQVTRIS